MSYDILVVDDVNELGRSIAELVQAKTGLTATFTSDTKLALKIAGNNPLKVAVLDQRMPSETGTELFPKLRAIIPSLQGVMLSGEASASDVGEALRLGFVDFVAKDDLDRLIPAIQTAAARSSLAQRNDLPKKEYLGCNGLSWIPYWPKSRYYLKAFELFGEPFVPEDSWKFVKEINVGESVTFRHSHSINSSIKISDSIREDASAGVSLALAVSKNTSIQSNLASTLSRETATDTAIAVVSERSQEMRLELPKEPSNPSAQFVRSRAFFVGTEFKSVRALIEAIHIPNNLILERWINTAISSGRFWNKQVDTLNDGSQREIVTSRW